VNLKKLCFTNPVVIGVISASAMLALGISCATVKRVVVAPPMIPGAKYVGMEQCALCHEKEVKHFDRTQHSRLQLREVVDKEEVAGLGCEACHGPGSLHVEAGGGKGKFILSGKEADSCFQCHLDKRVEFSLASRHPVREGKMHCTACHNPHGEDINVPAGALQQRADAVCAQCHKEQARPRVFEHEAMREGCLTCHNPHGSINPKLLVQRDNNLCLKCHAQVAMPNTSGTVIIGQTPHAGFAGNSLLQQGTCFSAGCHTAVHGSDVNSHLRY
jgi:predicted CXXCH cytochrome family protein